MGRKLYVGNLPYTTTEDELRDLFAAAGAVDTVNVVRDNATVRLLDLIQLRDVGANHLDIRGALGPGHLGHPLRLIHLNVAKGDIGAFRGECADGSRGDSRPVRRRHHERAESR